MPRDKTFNVYINDLHVPNGLKISSAYESKPVSLANVLHALSWDIPNSHTSICLEGCAVNNPYKRDFTDKFTYHLESQVNGIAEEVVKQLQNDDKLTLNLYGLGRGGAATFWICEKLKHIHTSRLVINVCALDPVPGNFMSSAYIDNVTGFKTTLAGIIADLRGCKSLQMVRVFYTLDPTQSKDLQAPILPLMPNAAEVLVDVIPGRHENIDLFSVYQKGSQYKVEGKNAESDMAFHFVTKSLMDFGTRFNYHIFELQENFSSMELDSESSKLESQKQKIQRPMHFGNEVQFNPGKTYLNLYYKRVGTGTKDSNTENCLLSVKAPRPTPTYWNGQKSSTAVSNCLGFFGLGMGVLASLAVADSYSIPLGFGVAAAMGLALGYSVQPEDSEEAKKLTKPRRIS